MKKKNPPPSPSGENILSHHAAESLTDEPLIRVMALHAIAYCERLFYLEEVEEIRRADANVYSGRRLHDQLDKGPDIHTLEIASEHLGIRGKLDCTKRESGQLVVYEHKRGRSRKGTDAWPSDRLQALAYTLLLAEHTGELITEARIRYHADNRTISIPVDPKEAEKEVRNAVEKAKHLRNSSQRPPVAVPENLCRTCSLSPVCLPEEERFGLGEKAKPMRLFPPNDEKRVIHIVEQGASVRKDGEQLVVYMPEGEKKPLPGMAVSALVLHGNVQVSTQVVHFCCANDIGLHWLSFAGNYAGGLSPGAGPVQRRNRQYQAANQPGIRLDIVSRIAKTKVENQLKYLLRATRAKNTDKARTQEMETAFSAMRASIQKITSIRVTYADEREKPLDEETLSACLDEIRGHEGMAGRLYFSVLPRVLKCDEDDLMYFQGRNRRPPRNPFNAALSFGYALLYRDCVSALLATGLEPSLGFYHTPRSAAYPLALDLMELFRVIIWDTPFIGSINRKQWQKPDFQITKEYVWLSDPGKRKAISLYENRKQEKWKHPVLEYSLSYARTIELEARLLEKEWSGAPGSFARLRVR